MEKSEAFSAIANARNWVNSRKNRRGDLSEMPIETAVKESTASEYRRVLQRVVDEKRLPGVGKTNWRTRSVERSAWRFFVEQDVREKLRQQDRLQKTVGLSSEWFALVAEIAYLMDLEAQIQAQARANQTVPASVESDVDRRAREQRRRSKRLSLIGLPSDWRQQLLDAARQSGCPHLHAMQVIAAAGVRPQELVLGVRVTRANGVITFQVQGAKRSALTGAGQRKRSVSRAETDPLVAGLASGGEELVQVRKANHVEDSIRWYAQKLWPKRKHPVSAYTLRHEFAGEVKGGGEWSQEEVATSLGHVSAASQGHYGTSSRGKHRISPNCRVIDISGTDPVRVPSRLLAKKKRLNQLTANTAETDITINRTPS